jgi:hypothetical protein
VVASDAGVDAITRDASRPRPVCDAPDAGAGAIAFVQVATKVTKSSSSSSVSFATPVTDCSAIVVAVAVTGDAPIASVTDSQGNMFARAAAPVVRSDGVVHALYYALGVTGGSESVSVATAASDAEIHVVVHEYAGVATTDALDRAGGSIGSEGGNDTGAWGVSTDPLALDSAPELVFAFVTTTPSLEIMPGQTSREASAYSMTEDLVTTTVGTYSEGAMLLGNSGSWAILWATFRAK